MHPWQLSDKKRFFGTYFAKTIILRFWEWGIGNGGEQVSFVIHTINDFCQLSIVNCQLLILGSLPLTIDH
jgi:hypothetical protein